jgi:hypothetical protein
VASSRIIPRRAESGLARRIGSPATLTTRCDSLQATSRKISKSLRGFEQLALRGLLLRSPFLAAADRSSGVFAAWVAFPTSSADHLALALRQRLRTRLPSEPDRARVAKGTARLEGVERCLAGN